MRILVYLKNDFAFAKKLCEELYESLNCNKMLEHEKTTEELERFLKENYHKRLQLRSSVKVLTWFMYNLFFNKNLTQFKKHKYIKKRVKKFLTIKEQYLMNIEDHNILKL